MKEKINCIIVDDEQASHDILTKYLSEVETLELVGHCYNVIEATNFLHKNSVDLIFLDIEMPPLTGFDFLKSLMAAPKIILTTAHPSYALESYDYDIDDYLLKPIEFQRFLKAVNKLFFADKQRPFPNDKVESATEEVFTIKTHSKLIEVLDNEILYMHSLGNYIKLITKAKSYLYKSTTLEMEKRLSANNFIRIHKSYIININQIEKFTHSSVFINGTELPIGITYKRKLESQLKKKSY